jgi:hypothetical protein
MCRCVMYYPLGGVWLACLYEGDLHAALQSPAGPGVAHVSSDEDLFLLSWYH